MNCYSSATQAGTLALGKYVARIVLLPRKRSFSRLAQRRDLDREEEELTAKEALLLRLRYMPAASCTASSLPSQLHS